MQYKITIMNCSDCSFRDKCKQLCAQQESYVNQDHIDEWFLSYGENDAKNKFEFSNGLNEVIWEAFEKLNITDRDRKIFEQRYGLGYTLRKIAKEQGITHTMVLKTLKNINNLIKREVSKIPSL